MDLLKFGENKSDQNTSVRLYVCQWMFIVLHYSSATSCKSFNFKGFLTLYKTQAGIEKPKNDCKDKGCKYTSGQLFQVSLPACSFSS